jgi:hypothetical protein
MRKMPEYVHVGGGFYYRPGYAPATHQEYAWARANGYLPNPPKGAKQMSVALIVALSTGIPAIIAAITGLIVAIKGIGKANETASAAKTALLIHLKDHEVSL